MEGENSNRESEKQSTDQVEGSLSDIFKNLAGNHVIDSM